MTLLFIVYSFVSIPLQITMPDVFVSFLFSYTSLVLLSLSLSLSSLFVVLLFL